MWPNYALERSVRGLAVGAAGALDIFAPAALSSAVPRPAQRGRWADARGLRLARCRPIGAAAGHTHAGPLARPIMRMEPTGPSAHERASG